MATAYKNWHVGNKGFSFDGNHVQEVPAQKTGRVEVTVSEAARQLKMSKQSLFNFLDRHDGYWQRREHRLRFIDLNEVQRLVEDHFLSRKARPSLIEVKKVVVETPKPAKTPVDYENILHYLQLGAYGVVEEIVAYLKAQSA